jgi:transposase
VPAVRETALQLGLANGSRVVSLPGTEGTVRGFSKVSLSKEEGRPTVFRVARLDSQSPVTPSKAELAPVTRYTLQTPVPFTEAERRRLAPVADPRRVSIAVEQAGDRPQNYALIDIGMALWEMARHERVKGHSSPEALIVTFTRPSELSISRSDRPRAGRIVSAADPVLHFGPVAEFFAEATREGCTWRALPHDFPPWKTVYNYCQWFTWDGTWPHILDARREGIRHDDLRAATPSAAAIDSQSVKTAKAGPPGGRTGASG